MWPVKCRLKDVIEYAENPDKTTAREYLDNDLYDALRYVENDDKTDKQIYVDTINCSKRNAYAEMVAVQKRFGSRGDIVAWHGFQSFAEGEVTPDEAFEIGKETARRMWADKYQVVVTVHLNTDNLHCHFVVNPISFKDGSRFQNKIYNHRRLREISDEVCREYGKSVLENSSFYGGKSKGAYWAEKRGTPTHRDMLKRDVEYCLSVSYNLKSFFTQLYGLGYAIDETRMSVKGRGWERAVRLRSIGYTNEVIANRLKYHESQGWEFVRDVWNVNLPKKNKSVLLSSIVHDLEFNIEKSNDVTEIYIDLLLLVIIEALRAVIELKNAVIMSVELRHTVKDVQQLIYDYNFLRETGIRTIPQLDIYIEDTERQIKEYATERSRLRNKIRREKDPAVIADNNASRSEITKNKIEPLRNSLKYAKRIREKSHHLYDLLKEELKMEAPYKRINRNGEIVFYDGSERDAR